MAMQVMITSPSGIPASSRTISERMMPCPFTTVPSPRSHAASALSSPIVAPASRRNFVTSSVMSTKPVPRVWTASNDEVIVLALTVDGVVRED